MGLYSLRSQLLLAAHPSFQGEYSCKIHNVKKSSATVVTYLTALQNMTGQILLCNYALFFCATQLVVFSMALCIFFIVIKSLYLNVFRTYL